MIIIQRINYEGEDLKADLERLKQSERWKIEEELLSMPTG